MIKNNIDLVKTFIRPKSVSENVGNGYEGDDLRLGTRDYVYFNSYLDELKTKKNGVDKVVYSSDYAVMNGARYVPDSLGPKVKGRNISTCWLLTRYFHGYVYAYGADGSLSAYRPNFKSLGMRPAFNLDLLPVLAIKKLGYHKFDIKEVLDKDGKIKYRVIEFGKFPQTKAKNCEELEKMFKEGNLIPTGKRYLGRMNKDGSYVWNNEYEYDDKKYVRVEVKTFGEHSKYKDGTRAPANNTPLWVEVKPIKWKINNWSELPKELNPRGNGTAKEIQVESCDAIMSGIPYYPECGDNTQAMWQNSLPRAFFNDCNIHKTIANGNGVEDYKADLNFDFETNGFINEALMQDIKNTYKLLNQKRETGEAKEK